MNRRPLFFASLCAVAAPLALLAPRLPAQNAPARPNARPATPSSQTPGVVTIRNSPQGTAIYDDARGIAKLTKDVTIVQTGEDFILRAQEATYNRPKNQAFAKGNLSVETRDSTIKSTTLFADFNEKTLNFSGNVVINSHGKGDGIVAKRSGFSSDVRRKPIRITCNNAEWNYETRQAQLTGNIRIYQEDNVGTCSSIFYDEGQNIVQLRGKATFGNAKKQTFIGEDLLIYVDSGQVQSKNRVQLKIPSNDPVLGATPRATSRAPLAFPTPSAISDEDLAIFNRPTPTRPAQNRPAPQTTPLPTATAEAEDAPEDAENLQETE